MHLTGWFRIIAVEDGKSPVVFDIDNEMIAVAVDTTGHAYENQSWNYNIKYHQGVNSGTPLIKEFLIGSCKGFISTNDSYNVATALSKSVWKRNDSRSMSFKVEYAGAEGELKLSFYPVFAAENGESPIIYSLKPSHSAAYFRRDENGKILGDVTVKVDIGKTVGSEYSVEETIPEGYFIYRSYDNVKFTPLERLSPTAQILASDAEKYKFLFIELRKGHLNDANSIVVDKESIPLIVEAKNGSDGEHAVTFDADNEMIAVAVDKDGKAIANQEWDVAFNCFVGADKSKPRVTSVTASTAISHKGAEFTNPLVFTPIESYVWQKGDLVHKVVELASTNNTGKVSVSFYPVFPGEDGKNAVIYSLCPTLSALAFSRNAKGEVVGSHDFSLTVIERNGTETIVHSSANKPFSVWWGFDGDALVEATEYSKTITAAMASGKKSFKVNLFIGNPMTGTLIDTETIPIVIDGKDGSKGEDGKSVTILGSYNSVQELVNEHPKGNPGDGYLVNGFLYVWNGKAWVSVGKIQGPAGDSAYVHLAYANSADGSENFSTTDSSGRSYIGTYADHTVDDSENYLDYKWVFAQGKPGRDGNSVTHVTNYYKKSIDGVTAPTIDATWLTKAPPLDNIYRFLWNFERTEFTQQGSKDTLPRVVAYYSEDGRGVESITEEFGLSHYATKQPDQWGTEIPVMDAYNKYLWNRETITYTDGETQSIDAHIVGVYGDKGDNGKDAPIANPNLLHATSFKAKGLHNDKWNTRITATYKNLYGQDVEYDYADFSDYEGGLFNTKYMYAMVHNGVQTPHGYIDLVQQCIIKDSQNRKVRKQQWYTLSFWSKGEVVVYIYCNEKSGERVIESGAYVDGEIKNLGTDGHVAFFERDVTEWQHHVITFKTTNISYTSQILFRMFTSEGKFPPPPNDNIAVSLCCIKLEEGQDATPWCRSERDIRGARPDYPIWSEGKHFYCGEDGEDVISICEYGAEENGDPVHYCCKKTIDELSEEGVNDPVTSIQKHLGIWELVEEEDFILAGRIAAHRIDTKDLIVERFYSISQDGSRSVKIENGIQEFRGLNGIPNIKVGTDENGCAIFEFYDQNGVFVYGLGPSQIGATKNRQERWEEVKMKFLGLELGDVVRKGAWKTQNIIGKTYYRYTSAIIANVNQDFQGDKDQRTFEERTTTSFRCSGVYTAIGACGTILPDAHGRYDLPNKHPDNNPSMVGQMYVRTLLIYSQGKLVGTQPVYWSSSELGGGSIIVPIPPPNLN